MSDGYSELVSSVDERGVLWETRRYPFGGVSCIAVCRPESCADGHKCHKLDLGFVREAKPNTKEDLEVFAEEFRKMCDE